MIKIYAHLHPHLHPKHIEFIEDYIYVHFLKIKKKKKLENARGFISKKVHCIILYFNARFLIRG